MMTKAEAAVILGIAVDAKPASIRAAYLRLARKFHPDLLPQSASAAARQAACARFAHVAEASRVLSGEEAEAAPRVVVVGAQGAEVKPVVAYFEAAQRVGEAAKIGLQAAAGGHWATAARAGEVVIDQARMMRGAIDEVAAGPLGQMARAIRDVMQGKKPT